MADNTCDIRAKVSEHEHAVLTAVSLATGKEIAVIVRELIVAFSDAEVHRANLILRIAGGKGKDGSSRE